METWFERIWKEFLSGELKAGALTIGLRALDGVRKLVIVHHLILVSGVLCALSAFTGGFLICNGLSESAWPIPRAVLIYCLGVFVVSGGLLWYLCRSRTWAKALDLRRQIETAIRERKAAAVDAEALSALVTKIVEQKIQGGPSTGI